MVAFLSESAFVSAGLLVWWLKFKLVAKYWLCGRSRILKFGKTCINIIVWKKIKRYKFVHVEPQLEREGVGEKTIYPLISYLSKSNTVNLLQLIVPYCEKWDAKFILHMKHDIVQQKNWTWGTKISTMTKPWTCYQSFPPLPFQVYIIKDLAKYISLRISIVTVETYHLNHQIPECVKLYHHLSTTSHKAEYADKLCHLLKSL